MDHHISVLQDQDLSTLCRFLSEFPGVNTSPEQWMLRLHNWWDDNPAFKLGHIRGVVLRVNGNIVGFTGNIPTRMIWNDEEITVISGTTWRVLAEFRKYSMDLWLKHRELTSDCVYFNTTPSALVRKLLRALKFIRLPQPAYWNYYFGAPGSLINSPVQKGLATLQKSYSNLRCRIRLKTKGEFRLVEGSEMNDDNLIDRLWHNSRSSFSFTNLRDSRYLRWIQKTQRVCYVFKNDALMGYLAFNFDTTINTMVLVDIWPSSTISEIARIFPILLQRYRSYNLIIPSYSAEFDKIRFRYMLARRRNPNEAYVSFGKSGPYDHSRSFFTMLQGDYGL